jgi:hypothetical protein
MLFITKTWNNGHYHSSGAGYGLKITLQDREQFFERNWQRVILHLDGYSMPVEVNVAKASFWNMACGELIKKDIGIWLQRNNRARWPSGQPFEVKMTVVGDREFKVELIY